MDRNEIQNQLKEQEQVRGKAWESVDKENEKSKEEKLIEERQSALSVGQQAGEMMLGCNTAISRGYSDRSFTGRANRRYWSLSSRQEK